MTNITWNTMKKITKLQQEAEITHGKVKNRQVN